MKGKGYRLAAPAEARILALLDDSAAQFGTAARDRYAVLILQAMRDLAEDPHRLGVRAEPGIDPDVGFYHLRHSRNRGAKRLGRVQKPRHVIVFRIASDGIVDILGVIPDVVPAEVAVTRFVGSI